MDYCKLCFQPSEITERFESAPLVHRNIMLEYLLPWIYNIELVDSLAKEGGGASSMGGGKEKDVVEMEDPEQGCSMRRPGWGSKQASCVILNNLLFITAEVIEYKYSY